MKPRNQKIFVIIAAGLVMAGLVYSLNSDSIFGKFLGQFGSPVWDEVKPRDIVKNSIPITILEEVNGKCKVSAEKFDLILDHQYFVRANELSQKLQFDRENKTMIMPCKELVGEKSRLNVWYVIPEAEKHATKFDYFITEWEETPRNEN